MRKAVLITAVLCGIFFPLMIVLERTPTEPPNPEKVEDLPSNYNNNMERERERDREKEKEKEEIE